MDDENQPTSSPSRSSSLQVPPHVWPVIQAIDQAGRTVRFATKWGAIAFCGYEFFHAVQAFAGHETDLSVAVSAWIETKTGVTISASITLGTLGMAYGYWQDRLRRRNIKRMGHRIAELESHIDSGRTSSGLLPDGRTPTVERES